MDRRKARVVSASSSCTLESRKMESFNVAPPRLEVGYVYYGWWQFWKLFSHIPGFCLLDASSISLLLNCNNQKYVQILPNVFLREQNYLQFRKRDEGDSHDLKVWGQDIGIHIFRHSLDDFIMEPEPRLELDFEQLARECIFYHFN